MVELAAAKSSWLKPEKPGKYSVRPDLTAKDNGSV